MSIISLFILNCKLPNASGAIDPHETLRDAAIRETKEEVGLQVLQKDLTLVHTLHALTEGDEWIGEFFITNKWTGKEGVQEPHKHSEIRWVALDNLSGEFIPYVKQAINQYLNKNTYSSYGW